MDVLRRLEGLETRKEGIFVMPKVGFECFYPCVAVCGSRTEDAQGRTFCHAQRCMGGGGSCMQLLLVSEPVCQQQPVNASLMP